ncbi:MAG: hypothetical protein U0791_17480 [Gemmataceae bacterium]
MYKAMMIVAAVSAGAWTAGTQANSRHSCCAPGADCCLTSCCVPGADCCFPGSDCCVDNCCTSFVSAVADEKPAAKEVKLTGTLVCGACKLNESKKCTNVLQVKDKDKTINYWLTDKGNDEPYHEKVCGGGELKDVTVTGVVTEKDGKKTVKASKVDVK